MKVEVTEVSTVKKILKVEIPNERVTRELDDAYRTLKKTAKLKGFRPGKAPRAVLENYYKKDVLADIANRLLQESFPEAIKETDLSIVGKPEIDPGEIDEKSSFTYEATVENRPEMADIDYEGLELTKNLYPVTDKDMDAQLNMIQRNLTTFEPIEKDRPLQTEDAALIDYEVFQEGKPFDGIQKAEKYTLNVGTGQISKDLDDQILGMVPGDNRDITVNFPEDHSNAVLAGQEVVFQVTLHEIRKEIVPEINDALAKKAGDYENLDSLKEAIVDNLKQGFEKRVEQELNEQIFTTIIERTEFELPEALIEYELEGIISEAERSFQYQNISMEDMGLTREVMSERYRETAERQVRRHLILDQIIKQDSLTLADDSLEAGYKEMSGNLGQTVEDIKTYYRGNEEQLEFFKHSLLEKQTIGLIIEKGKITEVVPEMEPETPEATDSSEDEETQ